MPRDLAILGERFKRQENCLADDEWVDRSGVIRDKWDKELKI